MVPSPIVWSRVSGDTSGEAVTKKESVGTVRENPRLLSALQSGDEHAFEKLVHENSKHLFAVASRMLRNEEDARDAVQDAFLAAFRSVGRFQGESRISTWLHRIVVNAALVRLRRRRRKPEESIEEILRRCDEGRGRAGTMPTDPSDSADKVLLRREVGSRIRHSIQLLPSNYRTVVRLRDIEELGLEETARLLGTTPNAAKIRLHRARKALRHLLADELTPVSGTAGSMESLHIKEVQ